MDDSLQGCLRVKIRLDLCIQQDRGSGVYEIESFYDMLLLACLCSWNGGNIFEIHLDFFQRQRTLDRFALAALLVSDAVVSLEDFPDRPCRAGQCLAAMLQLRVTRQVIQDCSWSGSALEILRRSIPNGQNAFFHLWICLRIGGFASKWLAEHNPCISWRNFSLAFDPLLAP